MRILKQGQTAQPVVFLMVLASDYWRFLGFGRNGPVVIASSGSHPARIRSPRAVYEIWQRWSLDHSNLDFTSPKALVLCVLRRLSACSRSVAQWQFSGVYGPLLSDRSISRSSWYPDKAAQSRNGIKERHSSQTVIPLPPQSLKRGCVARKHLPSMSLHIPWSLVPVAPCLVNALIFCSLCKQPQD